MPESTPSDTPSSRTELRRRAFLDAARDVFLQQGYDTANMSEIVKRAGGSMATLYTQFGDKQGLFLAVLEAGVSEFADAFDLELQNHAPIREDLVRIGEQFASALVQPASIEMYRLIISLGRKFPDITTSFLQRGPLRMRVALGRYLEERAAASAVSIRDSEALAALFLDMIRSGLQTRSLLDPSFKPTKADVREHVERAVDIFLLGVASQSQSD